MATKGQKMTHFRECHKIMKNNETFLSNHLFMQKHSFSEVQETRNSKKKSTLMAVSGQKQVKYSQSRLKMTKKLQNSNFLVNLIGKTKTSL